MKREIRIARVTDPAQGPLDGVKLHTNCAVTRFAPADNPEERKIAEQSLQIPMQPRRGDIFFADLRRQGNNTQRGCRPVIILQNNKGNINSGSVIVAIITTAKKRSLPTHVPLSQKHGLKRPSTAVLEDILTIDKRCLSNYLGTVINTDAEKKLDHAIKISLGLEHL